MKLAVLKKIWPCTDIFPYDDDTSDDEQTEKAPESLSCSTPKQFESIGDINASADMTPTRRCSDMALEINQPGLVAGGKDHVLS